MAIKLFGGRITIGKDLNVYAGKVDDFFSIMQGKYGTDYTSRNRLKAYKGVVYGCVSLIGESLGAYQPVLQQKKGDQWQKIDHEFIELLERPAGDRTPLTERESFSDFDLWEQTGIYQLLQGDAVWYMALGKTTGRPREIVVLRPDRVGTDVDPKTGKINGYFIRRSTGDPIPLETREVLRFPFFNPEDPYSGLSPVGAGSDYIGTDESAAKYVNRFLNNNANISGVLQIKGEVTKGAFRKFVRAWRDKYEGIDNAGKVAIVRDSDASFEKVGLGLNELDMAGLRKMSLDDVAMLFRVPLPLLGKLTESTGLGRGNIETLEYIFAKYNIDKKMSRFDAVLQFALERYYGLNPTQYRISHENIIPEDKEFELNSRDKGVDRWLKRNEIRDLDGLDAVDGGDQLFVPLSNIPVNESSLGAPEQQEARLTLTVKRKVVKATLSKEAMGETQKETFRLRLMRNQGKYERKYRKTIRPIFEEQRKEALVNLEAHASALEKATGQPLFDKRKYNQKLIDDLRPMLIDLAETQGALALVFAGDTENTFHLTSQIEAFIARSTQRMAGNFNEETLERLNKTLAEGIQEGEGIGALKKRVNTVYDNIDGTRSLRLARTETLKASNNATIWAYKQTGYVKAKKWYANPGACEFCDEMAARDEVALDEIFVGLGDSVDVEGEDGEVQSYAVDYEPIESPPLHPNCRCTIIPVR